MKNMRQIPIEQNTQGNHSISKSIDMKIIVNFGVLIGIAMLMFGIENFHAKYKFRIEKRKDVSLQELYKEVADYDQE